MLNTVLEAISLLNIGLLSVASSYQLLNNQNSMLITTISVSIAFITFTFIVFYHTSVKPASLKICKDTRLHLAHAKMKIDEGLQQNEEQNDKVSCYHGLITHSSIELQEPLLEEL